MPASPHRQRIRQSWQPARLQGAPAKIWLIVRRFTASLIAVALIGWCLFLLYQWVTGERTYFVRLSVSTYQPLRGQPISYANRDFLAFQKLEKLFANCEIADPFAEPLTANRLLNEVRGDSKWNIRSKDTLILYLTAHGVVRDKQAWLLCETENEESEFLKVADLLTSLKNVAARTKLLIIDAGRNGSDTRLGPIINSFPKLLDDAIQEARDPYLWVISANDSFERSHISPALRQSVFGIVLSSGLGGDADNNSDGQIALNELVSYLRTNVSNWVKQATLNNETQTPRLMHFNSKQLSAAPILLASSSRSQPAEPNTEPEKNEVREDSSIWSTISADLKEIVPEHLRELPEHLGGHGEGGNHGGGEAVGSHSKTETPEAHDAGEVHDSAKAEGGDESQAENNLVAIVQRKLQEAWEKCAQIETSAETSPPSTFAPPLWRELNERLLWYEKFCTAELPVNKKKPWQSAVNDLSGINRSLHEYSENAASKPRSDNIVDRIRAISPRISISVDDLRNTSVALLKLVAANDRGKPIPDDLKSFTDEYRDLLNRNDSTSDDLNALLDKNKELRFEDLYEYQLLKLRGNLNVPWELLRLALLVRLEGEQVAANLLCGTGWVRQSIESADRLRTEGERTIFDQTDANWQIDAQAHLSDARTQYQRASEELRLIQETIRKRNLILAKLPDYVRVVHLGNLTTGLNQSWEKRLSNLFTLLKKTGETLAEPSGATLSASFPKLSEQLHEALAIIDDSKNVTENPALASDLLLTNLLSPELRLRLTEELPSLAKKSLPSPDDPLNEPPPPTSGVSKTHWDEIVQQLEIELELARLAGIDDEKIKALEEICNTPDSDDSDPKRWDKIIEASEQLKELYSNLPQTIKSLTKSRSLTEDAKTRSTRLAELRQATTCWILLDRQHQENIEPNSNLVSKLEQAAWYDLLHWHSLRFYRAAVDVPKLDHDYLLGLSANLIKLANSVPNQPKLTPHAQPQLLIEDVSWIALDAANDAPMSFTVRSLSSTGMPVWLFAQYDKNLLDVKGVYPEDKLNSVKNESYAADRDLIEPDYASLFKRFELEPSRQIPPGASQRIDLKVSRLNNAEGSAKLIIKAVSEKSFVRNEAEVRLPGRDQLTLSVDSEKDFWEPTNQGILLKPLPGHIKDFSLQLANRTKVEKKIRISFLKPQVLPKTDGEFVFPSGALDREDANKVLERFKPIKLTADFPEFSVTLPSTGKPTRLEVPDSKQANLLPPDDPASTTKTPKLYLPYGLLAVLEDENGKMTIRRIEILPQRPFGYLEAKANYDATTRELEIIVRAPNSNLVPTDGFHFLTRVEGISRQFSPKLDATLNTSEPIASSSTATESSARMYARLLANQREINASVDVDGYPRAFIFRFRGESHRNVEPKDDLLEIRIVKPESRTSFSARETVPASVQVDAPKNSFGYKDRSSFFEIGIDKNRDGEFLNEDTPSLKFFSDRQLLIEATGFSPLGTLTLKTSVDDFHDIPVNSSGLMNDTVDLLAQLHTASSIRNKLSKPVEIHLDGIGPRIIAVLNPSQPNREVVVGNDLEVLVQSDPNEPDLSGIKAVDVAWDLGVTRDQKDAKWEVAKSVVGGWFAKLPTKDLAPRRYTVLMRATDSVGNVGILEEEVEVVVKPEPVKKIKPAKPSPTNSLSGEVKFGGDVVGNAEVRLLSEDGTILATVKSDASGRYTFTKVLPGKYTVLVEGQAKARIREGKSSVTVVAFPMPQPPANVDLH